MLLVIVDPRTPDHFWSKLCVTMRNHVSRRNLTGSQEYLLVEMVPTAIVNGVSVIRKVNWSDPIEIGFVRDSTARSDSYRFHLGKLQSKGIRSLIVFAGDIDQSAFEAQKQNLEMCQSDIMILTCAERRESSRDIGQVGRIVYLEDPSSVDETVDEVEQWLRFGDSLSEVPSNNSGVDSASGREVTPIAMTTEESSPAKTDLTARSTKPLRRREPEAKTVPSPQDQSQSLDRTASSSRGNLESSEDVPGKSEKRRWLWFKKDRKGNWGRRGQRRYVSIFSRNEKTRGHNRIERFAKPRAPIQATVKSVSEPRSVNGNIIVQAHSTLNQRPWHSKDWTKLADSGPGRDLEVEYGGALNLRIMAGSARGTRHQYYGEPNQDAFAIAHNEQFVILVVSDGVGAAKHAAFGSKFLSHVTARELSRLLNFSLTPEPTGIRQAIVEALQKASDSVQSLAPDSLYSPNETQNTVDRRELSATITVCVIPIVASNSDCRRVVCGYVGDSPCYTLGESGWMLRSKPTKDGEILDLATTALPNEIGEQVVPEFVEFDLGLSDSLFLMTDGIGTSLGSGQTHVGRWLGERLRNPVLATEWIDSLTFDRQGEDDDRTLIMLYDYVGVTERIKREAEDLGLPEDPGIE